MRPRRGSSAAWTLALSLSACGSNSALSIGRQAPADAGAPLPDASEPALDAEPPPPDVIVIDEPPVSPFRLVWRDEFDRFDPDRWEIARHTFEKNLADFSADNAYVENGLLKIAVRDKPDAGTSKPYTAAEVRTWQEFKYGRFVTSARFAKGAGVISAFFSFHDFYRANSPTKDWNEIVIELTQPAIYRITCSHESLSVADQREAHESAGNIGFDAPDQFHLYAFEWTPTELRFYVDGVQKVHNCDVPELMHLTQRLVMSAYPTSATWAATFDPNTLPVHAEFDWVELYEYVP